MVLITSSHAFIIPVGKTRLHVTEDTKDIRLNRGPTNETKTYEPWPWKPQHKM